MLKARRKECKSEDTLLLPLSAFLVEVLKHNEMKASALYKWKKK